MKPVEGRGIVTRKIGGFWITWNANLHSIGELNLQNSAAGETYWKSYNRYLDKFLFGRKDNPFPIRTKYRVVYRTDDAVRSVYFDAWDKEDVEQSFKEWANRVFDDNVRRVSIVSIDRAIEMKDRRKNPVDEPLTINYDQGNPRWLAEEREYAREKGYRHTAVGTRIPVHFGAVTAWTERDALIPVSWLADLPGLTGEERFTRQHDFDRLMQYMNKNNRLPPLSRDNNTQYSPFIQVWQNGNWYVSEGNHRIKVAKALGWKYMPVTIRWYSGAEEAIPKGMGYSIAEVMESDKRAHRAGYTVNDFRGIL